MLGRCQCDKTHETTNFINEKVCLRHSEISDYDAQLSCSGCSTLTLDFGLQNLKVSILCDSGTPIVRMSMCVHMCVCVWIPGSNVFLYLLPY